MKYAFKTCHAQAILRVASYKRVVESSRKGIAERHGSDKTVAGIM